MLLQQWSHQILTFIGPIVDAHDIKFVIIPGSIGMVASMIFVSLSTGKSHTASLHLSLANFRRVLSVPPLLRCPRWHIRLPPLQPQSRSSWTLVLQTPRLCNGAGVYCRRHRRSRIPPSDPLSRPKDRLPLGDPSHRSDQRRVRSCGMLSSPQTTTAEQKRRRINQPESPIRHEIRSDNLGHLSHRVCRVYTLLIHLGVRHSLWVRFTESVHVKHPAQRGCCSRSGLARIRSGPFRHVQHHVYNGLHMRIFYPNVVVDC